jgi:hypothetical protein
MLLFALIDDGEPATPRAPLGGEFRLLAVELRGFASAAQRAK